MSSSVGIRPVSSTLFSTAQESKEPAWYIKHAKDICIGILVVLALATLVLFVTKKKAETYEAKPTYFLPVNETKMLLERDFDTYGSSLNPTNLEACGVASFDELVDKWGSSASNWTPDETQKLQNAAFVADYAIHQKLSDPFRAQMLNIDWKFAKTIHSYYLDGLPHTRGDIIFLTDKVVATNDVNRLASLLVHEKTHLWQRKYKTEMEGWLEKQGFHRVSSVRNDSLQRSNPDINEWIYETSEGTLLGTRFTSMNPFNLHAVEYNQKMDHPYELMAYKVQATCFPLTN